MKLIYLGVDIVNANPSAFPGLSVRNDGLAVVE